MAKEITIKLADSVGDVINQEAEAKGLSPGEMIRFVLGSWAQQSIPPTQRIIVGGPVTGAIGPKMPILTSEMEQTSRDIVIASRISRFLLKKQLKSGEFKCSNCTLELDEEAFFQGKCGHCGAPLFEEEKPDSGESETPNQV